MIRLRILLLMVLVGCVDSDAAMKQIETDGAKEVDRINRQVAADQAAKYQITARQGGAMDRCVQASLVAAAYLQAKDEAMYSQWKKVERGDCRRAGLDR